MSRSSAEYTKWKEDHPYRVSFDVDAKMMEWLAAAAARQRVPRGSFVRGLVEAEMKAEAVRRGDRQI